MSTDPRPVPLRWFGAVAAAAVASVLGVLLLLGLLPRMRIGVGGGSDPSERSDLKIGELRQCALDLKPLPRGSGTATGVLLESSADGRAGWIEVEVRGQGGNRTLSYLIQADRTARICFAGEPGPYRWRARTLSVAGDRGPWKEFSSGAGESDFAILKSSSMSTGVGGNGQGTLSEPPPGTRTSSISGGGGGGGLQTPLPSVPIQLPILWSLLTSVGLILGGAASIAAAAALILRKRRTLP